MPGLQKSPWVTRRSPGLRQPEQRRLVEGLRTVNSELEREFGGKYYGLLLAGSRPLGYARPDSDLDYIAVCAHDIRHDVKRHFEGRMKDYGIEANHIVLWNLDPKLDSLRAREGYDAGTGAWVATYFLTSVGRRIHDARRMVLDAINDNPHPHHLWSYVRRYHQAAVAGLKLPVDGRYERLMDAIRSGPGMAKGSNPETAMRLRLERQALPRLSTVFKRYGVGIRYKRVDDSPP